MPKMPDIRDIVAPHEPEPDENPWVNGAPPREKLEIVAYDPAWPATFEKLAQGIEKALGEAALRIDHVGSTAVPGLFAKPVIDIDLTVQDPANEEVYVPKLAALGYQQEGSCDPRDL